MGLEDARERRLVPGGRGGSSGRARRSSGPTVRNPAFVRSSRSLDQSEQDTEEEKGPKTAAEKFGDPLAWAAYVNDLIETDLESFAEIYGIDERMLMGWYQANAGGMFDYIETQALTGRGASAQGFGSVPGDTQLELHSLYEIAKNWLTIRSPELKKMYTGDFGPRVSGGGSGRRGSGRGRGGPTADEIRAQFDLDQLSEEVNKMYRAYLLTDSPSARGIATAYVDAIVKNPDQKLDFQTFVLNRIRGEARHKSIYRNKPDSVDEIEYLRPYMQSAMSMLRPQNAEEAAIGGAQFGADPNAFAARLMRSDEVTGSAPFINAMEQRVSSVSKVFRG